MGGALTRARQDPILTGSWSSYEVLRGDTKTGPSPTSSMTRRIQRSNLDTGAMARPRTHCVLVWGTCFLRSGRFQHVGSGGPLPDLSPSGLTMHRSHDLSPWSLPSSPCYRLAWDILPSPLYLLPILYDLDLVTASP